MWWLLSLASFQLFGDSCNICSVFWYLARKSNSFFLTSSYFPITHSLLWALSSQAASFFQMLRSIRSSPKSSYLVLSPMFCAVAYTTRAQYFTFILAELPFVSLLSNMRSLDFSSSFTLLVTPPTFRLFAKYFPYCEILLLNSASKWLFPETIPIENLVQLAKTQLPSMPTFLSYLESCCPPNIFRLR